ncbi:amidase signature enzyme [Macrolepiota fuliginosa MF-IS2]|uniref:Amidase signature enzyme n=1 Tax=Macrolepiota fuliginosa MF-IS2 TaxID=1400762 RepID=A0A9P6BZF0_9AGAR|nr:amidase signature enzyme [Macrolepiota fuliginosa MF-IS2]
MKLRLFLSVSVFFSIASAAIRFLSTEDIGSIFVIEGDADKHYFLSAHPTKEVNLIGVASDAHDKFTAATSIRTSSSPLSRKFLDAQFNAFKELDDVWNERFLETLFVGFEREVNAFFDDSGKDWLLEKNVRNLYITRGIERPKFKRANDLNIREISDVPPHGPWLIRTPRTNRNAIRAYPVFGLVEDDHEAFTVGALPDLVHGGWISTNFTLPSNPGVQYIPVPTRLSAWSSGTLPFAGLRFAVKDIFNAKGLPTSAGSIAYERTYGKADTTAPSIQRLIDLGATLVGKTRTSQFAHGANPWEFVDFEYSTNPRGDGYLTAGASSSGSACAIAAYDWIDFTVGSDTRGSVRKPAALVGAFGIRPTHGTMDMSGIIPVSEEMDTVGFFTRDPRIFESIGTHWYAESDVINRSPTIRLPKRLLYPTDHFPLANSDAQVLIDKFTLLLRKHLNIILKPINITETLTPHFPSGSFAELRSMSLRLAEYRTWHDVGKPLLHDFVDRFGPEEVIDLQFDPVPSQTFKKGKRHSQSDFVEALSVKRRFARAMEEEVFLPNSKTCADSIFIYDAATGGKPSFRIEELNDFAGSGQFVMNALPKGSTGEPKLEQFLHYMASMGDLPEVTIPLGQVEYLSPVSGKWEWMPVAVQVVTRKGCDGVLYELVRKLGDKGIVKTVLAGSEAYSS